MSHYPEILAQLYARGAKGQQLGLSRVEAACARLGNPERAFQAVHVAGTNGKGTTCSFLASMASAAGKRVGLYTSPHLVHFNERIQVDGAPVPEEVLGELLAQALDAGPDLTFFEVATVAAFLAFRQAGVELAVLEVGLGGRLDATNVIGPPRVAAITRIAFDHTKELGHSLTEIAREKAGIIKAGSKVACGRLHPDALAVVVARAAEVGAELLELGSPEPVPGRPLAYPRTAMLGTNLAVATTVARELGFSPESMCRGIEAAQWPARNELLHRNGRELTLLDCAHNPDGAVTLSHLLEPGLLGEIESRREVALVFGTLARKNWRAMLRRLEQAAAHRVYVAPPVSEGAADPQLYQEVLPGEIASSVAQALERARSLVRSQGIVVVTGSIYLVGAARALLLGQTPDPIVTM